MISLLCGKMKQLSSIDLTCESPNNSSNRREPSFKTLKGHRIQTGLRQMTLHTWCLYASHIHFYLPASLIFVVNLTVIVCTIVHKNQIEFCIAI